MVYTRGRQWRGHHRRLVQRLMPKCHAICQSATRYAKVPRDRHYVLAVGSQGARRTCAPTARGWDTPTAPGGSGSRRSYRPPCHLVHCPRLHHHCRHFLRHSGDEGGWERAVQPHEQCCNDQQPRTPAPGCFSTGCSLPAGSERLVRSCHREGHGSQRCHQERRTVEGGVSAGGGGRSSNV